MHNKISAINALSLSKNPTTHMSQASGRGNYFHFYSSAIYLDERMAHKTTESAKLACARSAISKCTQTVNAKTDFKLHSQIINI